MESYLSESNLIKNCEYSYASLLDALHLFHPGCFNEKIQEINLLHLNGGVFAEIVINDYSSESMLMTEQVIKRINLNFIETGEGTMFLPTNTLYENAILFLELEKLTLLMIYDQIFNEEGWEQLT